LNNGLPKKSQRAKKEETIRHMNEMKKQEENSKNKEQTFWRQEV
jgi:hypothetical protein